MRDFSGIERLMGTREEMRLQRVNEGEDERIKRLLAHVDPYWEDREDLEMDVWRSQSPLTVKIGSEGEAEVLVSHTARSPEGEERHRQEGRVLRSTLIPPSEATLEEV